MGAGFHFGLDPRRHWARNTTDAVLGEVNMRLAVLTLAFFCLAPFAWAESSSADRAHFQEVISRQISAFKADDGAAAFGFASPDLQAKFGNAAVFMEMVRSGYAPV